MFVECVTCSTGDKLQRLACERRHMLSNQVRGAPLCVSWSGGDPVTLLFRLSVLSNHCQRIVLLIGRRFRRSARSASNTGYICCFSSFARTVPQSLEVLSLYHSQGPIDYKLYEAYGGGLGKAVSAVLNNAGATRAALGVFAGIVVSGFRKQSFLMFVPCGMTTPSVVGRFSA